jgi:hypothetical protein
MAMAFLEWLGLFLLLPAAVHPMLTLAGTASALPPEDILAEKLPNGEKGWKGRGFFTPRDRRGETSAPDFTKCRKVRGATSPLGVKRRVTGNM